MRQMSLLADFSTLIQPTLVSWASSLLCTTCLIYSYFASCSLVWVPLVKLHPPLLCSLWQQIQSKKKKIFLPSFFFLFKKINFKTEQFSDLSVNAPPHPTESDELIYSQHWEQWSYSQVDVPHHSGTPTFFFLIFEEQVNASFLLWRKVFCRYELEAEG